MVIDLSEDELCLLEIAYPVPNYPEVQKELWQKIRRHSTVSPKALDRIESMLLGGEFYDSYQDYVCYGAVFYALGLSEAPFDVKNEEQIRILESKLVKTVRPQIGGLTLMHFYDQYQPGKLDFHLAIDLGLDTNERIAFHKPGLINPSWITFSNSITRAYHSCNIEYFTLPERQSK